MMGWVSLALLPPLGKGLLGRPVGGARASVRTLPLCIIDRRSATHERHSIPVFETSEGWGAAKQRATTQLTNSTYKSDKVILCVPAPPWSPAPLS